MLVRPMHGSVSTMALASPALQTSHRSPEHLTHAVALIGAVRGALRSGLMEALQRWQPCTTDELAVRAHLVPRAVDLTLHALAAGGVVAEDAAGWTLQAPPAAWAGLVGFDEHICNFIETGAPTSADRADRYVDVLSVIGRFHETVAAHFAPALVSPCARVLELGAGTAPWSRALLALRPDRDGPGGRPAACRRPARARPCRRRRSPVGSPCRGGDVRHLALTEQFDVIVIAGLCRLLSDDDNAGLIAAMRRLAGRRRTPRRLRRPGRFGRSRRDVGALRPRARGP